MQISKQAAIFDDLLYALESAPFGAFAVSLEQKVLLWNRAAEHITGLASQEIVGQGCYEVNGGKGPGGLTPECREGCSSMRYLRSGMIPPPTRLQILTSSGQYKWFATDPIVVAGALNGAPILIHLFEESEGTSLGGGAEEPGGHVLGMGGSDIPDRHPEHHMASDNVTDLSRRELEVLRLVVAAGWEISRIAVNLGISRHTVRNHIRNLAPQAGSEFQT